MGWKNAMAKWEGKGAEAEKGIKDAIQLVTQSLTGAAIGAAEAKGVEADGIVLGGAVMTRVLARKGMVADFASDVAKSTATIMAYKAGKERFSA